MMDIILLYAGLTTIGGTVLLDMFYKEIPLKVFKIITYTSFLLVVISVIRLILSGEIQ